jgi:hypothetical protein
MRFIWSSKPSLPPLSALCTKVSEAAILNRAANLDPTNEYKRADILLMLVLMGAGHFLEKTLHWDKQVMWQDSRRYLRNTNLDVIAAEAIVWITFLMVQLWRADKEKEHEMYLRVGRTTLPAVTHFGLKLIESETGVDFKRGADASRALYAEAMKAGGSLVDPFASVILQSVGCRSLAEPRREIGPLPPSEFTPIAMAVNVFLATMPLGIWQTFKNILRELSDRFPRDEDSAD